MTSDAPTLVISVPDDKLEKDLSGLPGIEVVRWDMGDAAPRAAFDIVVPPYMRSPRVLARLEGVEVRLVQSQSIGYEAAAKHLPPGIVFANAASVHEGSTAELAVALTLASQRQIPRFVAAQDAGRWAGPREGDAFPSSLADRRVLIVGFGGVGTAIAARLRGFEAHVEAVATHARTEDGTVVHALEELPVLLPQTEIVILALPGGDDTAKLVDDTFLSALPDDALLVNVGRGSLVDTDALLRHLRGGRIRAALDVVDPEPVPEGHPLWSAPGLLLTPHVGGASTAMRPRIAALVRQQAERMQRGEEPINVVLRT